MLIYTDLKKVFMPVAYAASTAEKVSGETASELANLIELILAKVPLWIAAFILIILSIIAAKMARRIVENKMAEKGIEEEHKEVQILGGRMTYTVILTIGITVSLKMAGIDLTTIIAAVAFGVGFALKDLIMNFLAGVMILVGRHFTIGDFIKVGGTIGKVTEIQSRVTVLQAIDGTKVIVPNAEIFRNQVTSFTSNPFRRIEVETSIDYRGNLENAVRVCMKAVKMTKGVLGQPRPAVLVTEFSDYEIVIKVRAWVESRGPWLKVKSQLIMNIKKAYDDYNIDFPWPIRQVVYDKDLEHGTEKMLEEEAEKAEEAAAIQMDPADHAEPIEAGTSTPGLTVTSTTQLNPAPVVQEVMGEEMLKPLDEKR